MDNIYQAPQADLTSKKNNADEVVITQEMVDNLAKGRFWSMLMAVMSYIGMAVMVIAAISLLFSGGIVGIIATLLMGIPIFILFKMGNYLQKYSRAVKELIETEDIGDMLDAQEYFGRYIKLLGIIMVIFIFLAVFGIIVAIALPSMMGSAPY